MPTYAAVLVIPVRLGDIKAFFNQLISGTEPLNQEDCQQNSTQLILFLSQRIITTQRLHEKEWLNVFICLDLRNMFLIYRYFYSSQTFLGE